MTTSQALRSVIVLLEGELEEREQIRFDFHRTVEGDLAWGWEHYWKTPIDLV